ncbi:MAG: histidine phosphatase family protein, partial [Acidobacteriota bacterium]|nr:histidine phosphatase family protein [Acidobacteriota bacterium]
MTLVKSLILLPSGIEAKLTINQLMKFAASLFIGLFFFTFGNLSAQSSKKTLILVRHAEKDVSETADKNDPELSAAGRERAKRLVEVIGKYRPGAFYSTDFKRTRDSVTPLASRRKKQVRIYDARNPQKLLDEIMQSRTKRFVIAGHSNTIPDLANL